MKLFSILWVPPVNIISHGTVHPYDHTTSERHRSPTSFSQLTLSPLQFSHSTTKASPLLASFSFFPSFTTKIARNTMASIQIHPCLLFLVFVLCPALLAHAKTAPAPAAATADAPSPVAEPLSLNHILEKGMQYKTLLRMMKDTQVGAQVVNQLEDSITGLTVMAPTDNAFNSLKPGTLNKLTNQQQSELIMYHILPKYYSFVTFQTTSNPVPTQATSEEGTCTVNITSGSNQANISTGVDETTISNALYSDFPLAVYSVDKVLLPPDLFGPKSAKPAHSSTPTEGNAKKNSTSALAPSSDSEDDTNADTKSTSGAGFKGAKWASFVGVLLMFILNLL